jgi:hypothetical protein
MLQKLSLFLFIGITLFFSSCEKDITIKDTNTAQRLVVEAEIETGKYPIVILSNSLSYFSNITPETLVNSFVHNATVQISNGTQSYNLKEYTIPVNAQYAVSFYTVDPTNLATAFVGESEKNYSLNIISDNKTYTATTSIPKITRQIDSIWWTEVPGVTGVDTVWKKVIVKATDKLGLGDCIRYYTKVNSEPYFPGDPSAFDDDFIDGTSYIFPLNRGRDKNAPNPNGDFKDYYKRGDTVTVKVSQIDRTSFDFWETLEFSQQNTGNPFASPIKIKSNIISKEPVFGVFCGYAPFSKSLIIPK